MKKRTATIDIHNFSRKLELEKKLIQSAPIGQRNKELLLLFESDCLTGWSGKKIGKARTGKLLTHLRILAQILDKDYDYIDKGDVKRLLIEIDADPNKGEWTQRDYRIALRKFIKWMREEHGYPEDYPDRKHLTEILPMVEFPLEVSKIHVSTPNRLRPPESILDSKELGYLIDASLNLRDKSFFANVEELGPRIGGIGSRQLKHVVFDKSGALITISDKTMRNEPVRLVSSASYLRQWINVHPFRDNPEAPLWINLEKLPEMVAMNYDGFRAMIHRTVQRHNKLAPGKGLPLITKKVSTHIFRYYAQTRDEREQVPRTIMCRQRGWSPTSKMPEKYARLVSSDVDKFLLEKHGLAPDEAEKKEIAQRCKRCKEINSPGTSYCYKCGMPMSKEATAKPEQIQEGVDSVMDKLLSDPEVRKLLAKKMVEQAMLSETSQNPS